MRNSTSPVAYALAVNYAAMVSLAIAINLTPVLLTTLSHHFGGSAGLTNEQLGRVGAASFAGLVIGILITGPLADRIGPRPFVIGGNILIAAGLVILGTAGRYSTLLAAVFVMGLGAGVLDMILSPIVCALQPERRAAAMNWLHSFYCIGAISTVLTAAGALRLDLGWQAMALWFTAMPTLVCLSFLRVRVPPIIDEREERIPLRDLCRTPFFRIALAAIFLGGATELGMAQWLPAYAELSLGFTKWIGSMALLGFSVAMTLGRLIAGVVDRRVGPITLMIHCCRISVLLFLVACFAPWPRIALASSIAVGFTASSLWPSMLGVTADRLPRGGAAMFGLLAASGNFGGIFMPWLVGVTADVSSINVGLATATVCPLLMALLLRRMRDRTPVDVAT